MDQSQPAFTIRKGRPEDAAAIHRLIVELAIYERAENEVTTTVEQLVEDGFGSDAIYRLFVAEVQATRLFWRNCAVVCVPVSSDYGPFPAML